MMNNGNVQLALDYLGRVRRIMNDIEMKTRRLETLRDLAMNTTGQMTGTPGSGSPNLQRMETALCKVADLEREIVEARIELESAKIEIVDVLMELEDYREQKVLYGRYVKCSMWSDIAKECGCHIRTIRRYHDSGAGNLAALLERRSA